VEFAFNDDQLAFRDAVRELLAEECPPSRVRAAWSPASPGVPGEAWVKLSEMGVLGLLAPESAGGLGMTATDLVLILEETGRFAFPGPLVEHTAVAIPLLASLGDPHGWLDGAVAGRTVLTVGPAGSVIPWGDAADVVLAGGPDAIWACTRAEIGPPAFQPLPSVDGSRRLLLARGRPDGARPLAGDDAARAAWAEACDRAALGTAAQLLGLADRMLAMTVEYAKTRRQFGVPIGSYQAVKHHLADALLAVEFARPVVYRAADSLAVGHPDRSVHVSMAKAYAGDAALLVARKSLQCHGAIGYTTEYDLHLFMKRAWVLAASWGDAAVHRRRVADAVLRPAQGS
jgi:alkylation response protein AidB-like acyl-CoA dehydrogenase